MENSLKKLYIKNATKNKKSVCILKQTLKNTLILSDTYFQVSSSFSLSPMLLPVNVGS